MAESVLKVDVTASTEKLQSGLEQGKQSIKNFGETGRNEARQLRKEFNDMAKDIRGVGKTLGRIEGLGAGGLLGTMIGGGIGGFIGQGIEGAMKQVAPDFEKWINPIVAAKGLMESWHELKAATAGITADQKAWNDEIAKSATKLGPLLQSYEKGNQAIQIEIAALKDGTTAAEKLRMSFEGMPKHLQDARLELIKIRDAEKEAIKAREMQKNQKDILQGIRDKNTQLEFGSNQATLLKMSRDNNFDPALMKQIVDAMKWQTELLNKQKDKDAATKLLESIKEPAEQFADELNLVNRLMAQGFLKPDEAHKALTKNVEKLFPDEDKHGIAPNVEAVTKGSASAVNAINNARKGSEAAMQVEQQKITNQKLDALLQAFAGPPEAREPANL